MGKIIMAVDEGKLQGFTKGTDLAPMTFYKLLFSRATLFESVRD